MAAARVSQPRVSGASGRGRCGGLSGAHEGRSRRCRLPATVGGDAPPAAGAWAPRCWCGSGCPRRPSLRGGAGFRSDVSPWRTIGDRDTCGLVGGFGSQTACVCVCGRRRRGACSTRVSRTCADGTAPFEVLGLVLTLPRPYATTEGGPMVCWHFASPSALGAVVHVGTWWVGFVRHLGDLCAPCFARCCSIAASLPPTGRCSFCVRAHASKNKETTKTCLCMCVLDLLPWLRFDVSCPGAAVGVRSCFGCFRE